MIQKNIFRLEKKIEKDLLRFLRNMVLNFHVFKIRIDHPWSILATRDREHHISTGMRKGAGEKNHEEGLSLVIPRRMPHHSSSSS